MNHLNFVGELSFVISPTIYASLSQSNPGPKFTDIVLRFILRHVLRSSYDRS